MTTRAIVGIGAGLVLAACGKDGGGATHTYHHDGSVKFSIAVPKELEATPEKSDGAWTNVILRSKGDQYSDVLINWQPGWTFDEASAWFHAHQAELGPLKEIAKEDLPDGRGFYVHYEKGVPYGKAIVRCGSGAVQCMATIATDDPAAFKDQVIAACKTLVCK